MRFARCRTAAAAALVVQAMLAGAAAAQDTTVVRAGTLLRVTVDPGAIVHARQESRDVRLVFPRGSALPGSVTLSHPDSITLTDDDGTRTIAISDITRIEVASGRHRHVLRGALIGATLGATFGVVAGHSEGGERTCNDERTFCSENLDPYGGAILFGVVGGVLGAAFGFPSHQSWATIPEPWRVEP